MLDCCVLIVLLPVDCCRFAVDCGLFVGERCLCVVASRALRARLSCVLPGGCSLLRDVCCVSSVDCVLLCGAGCALIAVGLIVVCGFAGCWFCLVLCCVFIELRLHVCDCWLLRVVVCWLFAICCWRCFSVLVCCCCWWLVVACVCVWCG